MNSAKMALVLEELRKNLSSTSSTGEIDNFKGKVKFIIRLQVQPWHGSSTFLHEAALAVSLVLIQETTINYSHQNPQVARVSPESFWPFSLLVGSIVQTACEFTAYSYLVIQKPNRLL